MGHRSGIGTTIGTDVVDYLMKTLPLRDVLRLVVAAEDFAAQLGDEPCGDAPASWRATEPLQEEDALGASTVRPGRRERYAPSSGFAA